MFKGLPLPACRTRKKDLVLNSQEFVVKEIKEYSVRLKEVDHGTETTIAKQFITTLFYPGYCMTVFKAQGCTFKTPYTVYEWDKMNIRMRKVAITRGTKFKNVNIVL